jgi:predicted dithiol-disulfide oxidoreductase (DUF899 family)
MWADGYNGIHHHIATRAAFVVSSPEPPEVQRKFAASRGWKFPMISHAGSTFAADMGFRTSNGGHCREPAILHAVPERRFHAQLKCRVLTCAVPRPTLTTNH